MKSGSPYTLSLWEWDGNDIHSVDFMIDNEDTDGDELIVRKVKELGLLMTARYIARMKGTDRKPRTAKPRIVKGRKAGAA